jgi:hypothetical protein
MPSNSSHFKDEVKDISDAHRHPNSIGECDGASPHEHQDSFAFEWWPRWQYRSYPLDTLSSGGTVALAVVGLEGRQWEVGKRAKKRRGHVFLALCGLYSLMIRSRQNVITIRYAS